MSTSQPMIAASVEPPNITRMYVAVMAISLVCSLAIVGVYQWTRPIISRNRLDYRQQAIHKVLPGASIVGCSYDDGSQQFQSANTQLAGSEDLWVVFSEDNQLVGWAIEAQGMGYQDAIRILYGISTATRAVTRVVVLESRETPGLGDRIETEPQFLEQFKNMELHLEAISDVDGISGATISSKAVVNMLGESAELWGPRVFKMPERAWQQLSRNGGNDDAS